MARTDRLDTRTTNFLELVGNGRVFRVPPYQRDYSWTEEQWEDLWNDVADLRTDRAERHYLGAIVVEDELNAYTVFETLNACGLELSATDLLKNYLFSRVRVQADLEALQRRWLALIGTVRQEHFPELLRYHMQTLHAKVRSVRLFRLVRESVRTPEQVFALMEALEDRADLFAALADPNHEYWIDLPAARHSVQELRLFRVRQMTPLLFAAWERLSRSDFIAVLRIVSMISFRYTIVSGLNPNALEPAYYDAARAVLTGTARRPGEIFERLRPIYVDDGKFEQDMAQFDSVHLVDGTSKAG